MPYFYEFYIIPYRIYYIKSILSEKTYMVVMKVYEGSVWRFSSGIVFLCILHFYLQLEFDSIKQYSLEAA